jgi:nucleoside-diphosphate-sugar epimerase
MKALVSGANGFTGSHLTKLLLKKGYEIRGIVRKNANLETIKNLPIEIYYADLATHNSFDDAMKDIDIVFHVGAAYRVEGVPEKYFWDVNLEGTRKLLEAAKKKGVKRFVHCSTGGVQGHIKKIPAKEEDPYNAGDYYQKSKLAGEKLALQYCKEGLPITIVRPTGIYGPGDTRYLKLFKFINNGSFKMIGSGNVFHHLVFVEDLAEGILLAGEKKEAVGEIFTIGGEGYYTLNELVKKVAFILKKPTPKMRIPYFPVWFAGLIFEIICKPFGIKPPIFRRRVDFFVKDRAFDISKAKRVLGYKPKIDIDEGLSITAEWYKERGLLN